MGCCIINFLEYRANGWYRFATFSWITCICQTFLMVTLRGHYFIDLISGMIFAHYAWMLAERYSYLVDVNLFHIPFAKRFPLFTQSCPNCQHPVSLWVDKKETNGLTSLSPFRGGQEEYHDEKDGSRYPYADRGGI